MPDLLARIRAALRRSSLSLDSNAQTMRFGRVEIDVPSRGVMVDEQPVPLTPKEFDLLSYFLNHANKVISHRELLQAVWGPDYGDEVEYLRVFVKQLRKKPESTPDKPEHILTEPWVGYRFHLPQ
jgi:two-component system KDP operon response regulator KdpE